MIELKRLKLINWHNFENVTFDCARLTYMIGVNAVGKTTILDAIRYCLTTNRNFNALGNKKSGRTLQGSVHAKQRGENAYRRPGRTVAYIGAEFWDTVKRTNFVIAVRVESEGPMQELHPGDQTWYISEDGITLEKLPFLDPRTGAPSAKEDFKPAVGRLSYTRSPSEARDRICRALGIGRASSPLGKKFNEVFQMGTSMDEIPNFREFLYQYILPQPELDLEALQGDRVELENLHAVLAEAQIRAAALEQIVAYGREAAAKETDALVNRGAALLARAEADAGEDASWQSHLDAGRRQLSDLNAKYEAAKNAEAEARRAYLAAHGAAGDSGAGRALDALTEELARKKSALDAAARTRNSLEATADTITGLLTQLNRSGFAVEKELWPQRLTAEHLPALTEALARIEKPLEEQYFAARQASADLAKEQEALRAELNAVSGGKWVYPHGDAATKVRDAVNAELKSRGMTADAKIFCELLTVADESWQDCVEACLGDRRFDILVPPAHYAAAKSAFVALGDRVGPISLLDTPGIRKADRHAETAPADSLAAQVTSENPLAAQYADTILRRIVCCDTPDTLEHFPDSATRDLLRHHPFRLERLRRPQRYIGLDARRERADALEAQLADQTDRCREAAQTEKTLKSAYDQYQNVLRGHALEQLAELWASRAALDAARADYAAQEQKLADCRENPMLQQLYREEEAREAAWETARKAVEQVGGDIRVCEKQIASCEAEQSKAVETAAQSREAAEAFFAQHPLLEPLAQERKKGLMTGGRTARAAAQTAEKAQTRLDDALRAYLTSTLEPAQRDYNEHYVCDYPLGLAGVEQTEKTLKSAYDQYQNVLRGHALEQLAELWASRAALDAARADYAAQEQKLADCRENPMLQQLYREEEAREAAWETARKAVEQVGGDIRVCEKQIASCEAEQSKAVETAAQSREAAEAFFAQHPLLEPLAQERKKGLMTGGRTARAAAQTAEKAQTRLDDALRAYLTSTLEPAQRDYNEHYVCDYPLGLAGVEQYRAQHDSLVRIDLERYAARLEQAQRDCKDRFRKDILFRMKDDIFNARRQFRELNKVMEQLTYGEEVYRFELEPSRDPQLAAFYQVIVDKGNQQMTDGDSLDNLAATADPVYERQVDVLMEKIMADVDENTRARQEGRTTSGATLSDYVDYRTYLDYDIKVTNTVSGQQAYLSRVSRDSSGGENQAPFYVAICASLLQIYQKSENSIRLVLLDEAFSKMTSDRIRPMMELFRRLQLQVLLISTVEKSTAIQPYCDITYSIVRHGDANAIAPFYRAGTLADAPEKETEYE